MVIVSNEWIEYEERINKSVMATNTGVNYPGRNDATTTGNNEWKHQQQQNEQQTLNGGINNNSTSSNVMSDNVISSSASVTGSAITGISTGNNNIAINNNNNHNNNNNNNNNNVNINNNDDGSNDKAAKIFLHCQPNSHPFQSRVLVLEPNVEVKVGRSIARSRVAENNAIFDCKVLSRNHAVLWYGNGKFYVKDTRSSNGTFINGRRIDQSESEEIHSGDIIKFGVDVIENSRQEVHGCIIAGVRLYAPDGREYISEKSPRFNKVQEGLISFDELRRLNHFIQETVQREKMLELRLHDIQNIIEITRQNTTSCWQAMIDEDRLLNRIDILESKLNVVQKNVGEDKYKSEITKLQEDKYVYQKFAKEALRKVYQERMDALQKLSTIQRALCNSEDECSLLRDQMLKTQQNLQEVSSRLVRLEAECKENQGKVQEDADTEKSKKLLEELENKESLCEFLRNKIKTLTKEKSELEKLIQSREDKSFISLSENLTTVCKKPRAEADESVDNEEGEENSATLSMEPSGSKWLKMSDLMQYSTTITDDTCSVNSQIFDDLCLSIEGDEAYKLNFTRLREDLLAIEKSLKKTNKNLIEFAMSETTDTTELADDQKSSITEFDKSTIATADKLENETHSVQDEEDDIQKKEQKHDEIKNNLENDKEFLRITVSKLIQMLDYLSHIKNILESKTSGECCRSLQEKCERYNEEILNLQHKIGKLQENNSENQVNNTKKSFSESLEKRVETVILQNEIRSLKTDLDKAKQKIIELEENRKLSSTKEDDLDSSFLTNIAGEYHKSYKDNDEENKIDNDMLFLEEDDIRKAKVEAMIRCEEELIAFKEQYENLVEENIGLKSKLKDLETNLKRLQYHSFGKYFAYIIAFVAFLVYLFLYVKS